jgi:DNA-binding IclR family transcriptional regulator
MHALASELSAECVFSALVHDEIVILGSTGAVRLGAPTLSAGSIIPCAPPLGTVFVAWMSDSERAQRRERGLDIGYEVMSAELEEVRRLGYVATLSSSESWLLRVLSELPSSRSDRNEAQRQLEERLSLVAAGAYLASHGEGTGEQEIEALMAPVFRDGSPQYALTASHLGRRMSLEDLSRNGTRVSAAAAQISGAIADLSEASALEFSSVHVGRNGTK